MGTRLEVRRVAAVDLGTNAALLCVVEQSEGRVRVLEERCEVPRLGAGLDRRGTIAPDAAERTLAVLREYAAVARAHGARLRAVGTQALREARGVEAFLARAGEALGAPLEVIDGAREAELAFRAVVETFPEARGRAVVVDVGGGSTEIIRGEGGRVAHVVSIPMGSVRLTERTMPHDPPSDDEVVAAARAAGEAFASVEPAGEGAVVVGVAGTVTTLASVALALPSYDADRVHGSLLAVTEVDRQIEAYRGMDAAARRAVPGMDPRRADVILGGAVVVVAMARRLGAREIVVSDRGVRWGLVHEMLE